MKEESSSEITAPLHGTTARSLRKRVWTSHSQDEEKKALRKQKAGKAARLDGAAAQNLRLGGNAGSEQLLRMFGGLDGTCPGGDRPGQTRYFSSSPAWPGICDFDLNPALLQIFEILLKPNSRCGKKHGAVCTLFYLIPTKIAV